MADSLNTTPAPEIPADLPRVHRIGGPSDDKGGFNRRKVFSMAAMLAGLAGTVALPALATPKLSEAAVDPDAELRKLGRLFEDLYAVTVPLAYKKSELHEIYSELYFAQRRGDDQSDKELRERLHAETGYGPAWQAWNDARNALEVLAKKIRELPARTTDGLVVKGKVLWNDLYDEDEDLHWEAAMVRDFLAELDSLASNPVHALQTKVASAFEAASGSAQVAASSDLVALFDAWQAQYQAWTGVPGDLDFEVYQRQVIPAEEALANFAPQSLADLSILARYLLKDGFGDNLCVNGPHQKIAMDVVERLAEMAVRL